jgi:DNA polymerase-1
MNLSGHRLYNGVRMVNAPSQTNIRRLDMGALPMVIAMERNGIAIDPAHFAELSKYLKIEEDRLSEEFKSSTGYGINLGSPDQTADVLFSKTKLAIKPMFKIPLVKSGKRPKLDDGVLDLLVSIHPCINIIKEWRHHNKMRTSYADVLPTIMGKDGRVRTSLRVTRQVTGRISSSDPNLSAIPVRSELGRKIRNGFIAQQLHGRRRKLATIDLSQIQMRLAAHEANSIAMLDTFLRDGDIHSETASRMFNVPIDLLDKMQHRYPAKRVGFGILFGLTEEGLLDQMLEAGAKGWTLKKCKELIELWFAAYPEIRAWMIIQQDRARRWGFVWDMFGRIRHLPQVRSVHKRIVAEGLRMAGNTPIQSAEQGVMKLAMAEIMDEIEANWGDMIWPLQQIHDELLFEGDEEVVDDFMQVAKRIAENCVPLNCPIKSGYATADRWGELEK